MNTSLKALITIAFLSLFAIAHAQTSVTLYGTADTALGYEQFKYKGKGQSVRPSNFGLHDAYLGSSRWGLRGSEVLSSDLTVFFNFEQGVKLLTGQGGKAPRTFDRMSILGLKSDSLGTVTFGRQKTLGKDFLKFGTTKGMGKPSRAFGVSGARVDNLIKYVSPTFHGLRAGVGIASNGGYQLEKSGEMKSVKQDYLATAGLHYKRGSFSMGAVYDWQRPNNKAGKRENYTVRNWAVAMTYDFDVVKINIGYGEDRNGKFKSPGYVSSSVFDSSVDVVGLGAYNTHGFHSRNYLVSMVIPMESAKLNLTWTRSSSNLGAVYAEHNPGKSMAVATQNIVAASYVYSLSKRTSLYAYGGYGWNLAYVDTLDGMQVGIGLNHKF